jgi:hypothetical protein
MNSTSTSPQKHLQESPIIRKPAYVQVHNQSVKIDKSKMLAPRVDQTERARQCRYVQEHKSASVLNPLRKGLHKELNLV